MHIPDDPLFNEKYYFTPGDGGIARSRRSQREANGFKVWKTRYATIGVLICWDQWYPEAARITACSARRCSSIRRRSAGIRRRRTSGAQAQVDAWRTMQRAHAIANGVYVASPNRVGHEDEPGTDGITFFGHSFICRSVRALPRRSGRERGDPDRAVRSRADRDRAAQLAVPARPPRRRLRADPQPLPRLVTARARLRMPAEWEPHARPGSRWPHHEPDWPGKLGPIPWVYAEIARVLAEHEPVEILCHDRRGAGRRARRARRARRPPRPRPAARRADRSRLAARLGADRRARRRTATSCWCTGRSTPGRSTTTTSSTTQSAAPIAAITGLPREEPRRPDTGEPHRARGRRHRGQRRGLLLVTEEWLLSDVQVRNPGPDARRLRGGLRATGSASPDDLARRGLRRRRHARPRRRHRALRQPTTPSCSRSRTIRPTRTTQRSIDNLRRLERRVRRAAGRCASSRCRSAAGDR